MGARMHEHIGRPMALMLDVAGLGVIAGTYAGYLPDIAAGFAAVWYITQIWDSKLGRKIGHYIRQRVKGS